MTESSNLSEHEVYVSKEKYLEIIGFTIYAYLEGWIQRYSNIIGGVRALGEYLENFIYGKVAEEALREFLQRDYGIQTLTDLDIADFIEGMYLPDLVVIEDSDAWQPTEFWIEVKELRRNQRWLLVPASATRERPYDAYVAVWVGLPDEHLAWLIRKVPEVQKKMSPDWHDTITDLGDNIEKIPCEVCGYATWHEVNAVEKASNGDKKATEFLNSRFGERGWFHFDGKTDLFDPEDKSWSGATVGKNIAFSRSRLEKKGEWQKFAELLRRNSRLISDVPVPVRTWGKGKRRVWQKLPEQYRSISDFRTAYSKYLRNQLEGIVQRFGSVRRKTSWFAQPLRKRSQPSLSKFINKKPSA